MDKALSDKLREFADLLDENYRGYLEKVVAALVELALAEQNTIEKERGV